VLAANEFQRNIVVIVFVCQNIALPRLTRKGNSKSDRLLENPSVAKENSFHPKAMCIERIKGISAFPSFKRAQSHSNITARCFYSDITFHANIHDKRYASLAASNVAVVPPVRLSHKRKASGHLFTCFNIGSLSV